MKWLKENWILVVIIIAMIYGVYDFSKPDYESPNADCEEYETTSQGTFCTE